MGDPKVVVVLALAVLALPPVVNAIMTKAADQADMDWLRDEDPPDWLKPPENLRPREGPGPGEGPLPPPPLPRDLPGQQPCQLVPRGPPPVVVQPTDLGRAGSLQLVTEPGDLALLVRIEGQGVTGQPGFRLTEGGAARWSHQELHVRDPIALPEGDAASYAQPEPGTTWVLSFDLSGTAHEGITLALATQRCGGPAP